MTIIKFPSRSTINKDTPLYEGPDIVGLPKNPPKNGAEYLIICKDLLDMDDYMDVCVGILDLEYYCRLDPELKNIIDHYHVFEGNV